eukprot:14758654-Ditylum_brightwellii.AAC.1
MYDQKRDEGDSKKKKTDHLHLTTIDETDHFISNDDFLDDHFDDWGSVSLGSFMSQQIGVEIQEPYKRSLLNNKDISEPLPTRSNVPQRK